MSNVLTSFYSLEIFLLILKSSEILLQENNLFDHCGFWRSLADNIL